MHRINQVVIAAKATKNMMGVASYLYQQTQSRQFVEDYMQQLKRYFIETLAVFPESGSLNHTYGVGIRKLTHKGYVVLYQINQPHNRIEILNFFRDNLP